MHEVNLNQMHVAHYVSILLHFVFCMHLCMCVPVSEYVVICYFDHEGHTILWRIYRLQYTSIELSVYMEYSLKNVIDSRLI